MPESKDKDADRRMARAERALGGGGMCAHGGRVGHCPRCMAGGGEVKQGPLDRGIDEKHGLKEAHSETEMSSGPDTELEEACADELVEALEKKDRRGIVDAIRALVLNCKE